MRLLFDLDRPNDGEIGVYAINVTKTAVVDGAKFSDDCKVEPRTCSRDPKSGCVDRVTASGPSRPPGTSLIAAG